MKKKITLKINNILLILKHECMYSGNAFATFADIIYIKAPYFITMFIVLTLILFSLALEIITVNFHNIMDVLIVIKSILLKLKIINYNGMIIKPNILALNIIPLLIIIVYMLIACITFIIINWKLFFYIIFVYIFIKCLLTNFYLKHFKSLRIGASGLNNIFIIWQKRKIIALFLIKLFLLMIPIRFLIRIFTLTFFNLHNDIISIILLSLLTLPFVYYFKNILIKYIIVNKYTSYFDFVSCNTKLAVATDKKQNNSISVQDFFLFNDYVINNINLYNILYITLIILMFKYFFYYYLIIIFFSLIILLLIILWGNYKEQNLSLQNVYYSTIFPGKSTPASLDKNQHKNINLQASGPPLLTYTLSCLMHNLGMYLVIGSSRGYVESDNFFNNIGFNIYEETNQYDQFIIKHVPRNHFNGDINVNKHEGVTCYNWLHNSLGSHKDGVWLDEKIAKYGSEIMNSKILRMIYTQRHLVLNQPEFEEEVGTMSYTPQTLFKNDKFIGSVGRLNNTLVINFFKNDRLPKKEFYPSHYVYDDKLRHVHCELEPIENTIDFLENMYGIYIPNRNSIYNIITLTEIESLPGGDPSLKKYLRPCPLFTDLFTMYESPKQYFLCSKKQEWNLNKKNNLSLDAHAAALQRAQHENDKSLYNKIKILKNNVQLKEKYDEDVIYVSEDTLNELYCEYLNTRCTIFDPIIIESQFDDRSHLFYNYKSNIVKNVLFFREDDLNIFHFNKYTLINMTWTRRRLLSKLIDDNIYSSFYVVSANRITMELLSIERPYGEIPKIYSVIDGTNPNTSSKCKALRPVKQSFNILDKQDGDTLKKLLKYKF
uniref:Uncharacterized protein n=1 Tax=Hirsutella vermicola TaxID=369263 RepID=A0A1S6KM02_9HYPO|nr:hypothetical protein [Hirsutella vermicola]AQT19610.1 hypothetical protein [Hirsutella vermicola]